MQGRNLEKRTWEQELKWRPRVPRLVWFPFLFTPVLPVQELGITCCGLGSSHINCQSRKCPTDLPTGRCDSGIFSIKDPSSQLILAYVDIRTRQYSR